MLNVVIRYDAQTVVLMDKCFNIALSNLLESTIEAACCACMHAIAVLSVRCYRSLNIIAGTNAFIGAAAAAQCIAERKKAH